MAQFLIFFLELYRLSDELVSFLSKIFYYYLAQVGFANSNGGFGKVWKRANDLGLHEQLKEEWDTYLLGLKEEWERYILGVNHSGFYFSTGNDCLLWSWNVKSGQTSAKLVYDVICCMEMEANPK